MAAPLLAEGKYGILLKLSHLVATSSGVTKSPPFVWILTLRCFLAVQFKNSKIMNYENWSAEGHNDLLFDWLLFQCCCKSLEQDVLGCRPECGDTARSEPGSCTTTQKGEDLKSLSLIYKFGIRQPKKYWGLWKCKPLQFWFLSFAFGLKLSRTGICFMSCCTFHVWWRLWKYNVKWSCFINAPFKISLEERGMRSEAKRDIIDTAIETSFPHFFQHTIIRWSGSVFFLFFHTTDQDCHNNVWLSSSLLESLNQQTNPLDLMTSPIPVSCLICISSDLFGKQVMLPALNGTVCCFQTKVRA